MAKGHRISLLGDENVLKLMMMMLARLCEYSKKNKNKKKHDLHTLNG